jgi:lipopolysaccharide export system protein LptA
MEMGFSPDGARVHRLAARDGVQLDLPSAAGSGRRIRAVSLEADGPPETGLQSARFVEAVEFLETATPTTGQPAVERTARSRTLDTVITPGFGELQAARFGGDVVFREADLEATAPDAEYHVAKGTLRLLARDTGTGARVIDESGTVEGRRVELTLDGRSMQADGDVRSRLLGSPARERPGAGPRSRRPALLKEDQPVNLTAGQLAYDSGKGVATYTGDARLWQGETALQAETIVLDETSGNLGGAGNVRSTLRLEESGAASGSKALQTTVLTSKTLAYDDALRRATYTGAARMNGPEGDLRADRIELFLAESGQALDRIEAFDAVSLRTQSRTVTGARLVFFGADGRYVMSGTPVRALEQLGAECRETLGRTLTFFRSVDTITVDGNDVSRTQTTSGGKCPEPPKTE